MDINTREIQLAYNVLKFILEVQEFEISILAEMFDLSNKEVIDLLIDIQSSGVPIEFDNTKVKLNDPEM